MIALGGEKWSSYNSDSDTGLLSKPSTGAGISVRQQTGIGTIGVFVNIDVDTTGSLATGLEKGTYYGVVSCHHVISSAKEGYPPT